MRYMRGSRQMFVPLKRRRGMSRRPRILDVLVRKSSPSDTICSSQREEIANAKQQVLIVGSAEFADLKCAQIWANIEAIIKCGL